MVAWTCSATAIAQQANYQLSSHILDINRGQPASGVKISLSKLQDNHTWQMIDEKLTDENGRVKDFLEEGTTDHRGIYKLTYTSALILSPCTNPPSTRSLKWSSK